MIGGLGRVRNQIVTKAETKRTTTINKIGTWWRSQKVGRISARGGRNGGRSSPLIKLVWPTRFPGQNANRKHAGLKKLCNPPETDSRKEKGKDSELGLRAGLPPCWCVSSFLSFM